MKKSDFEKYLISPTLFSIHVLKIKPYKYQAQMLEDDSKRILIVAGRGVGKTVSLAIKALWNAFVKPNYEVMIVAPTLRQSRIVYETMRGMIRKNKFIYSRADITLHETRFDNESVIRVVPVGEKGDIARGFHPDMLIFDETAFMPDEAILAIEPSVLPKDGTIIYSSTPYGMHNRFYELYKMHQSDWPIYKIPSWQCPLAKKDFLESMRKSIPYAHYMQEYGAEFISEVGMLYPYDLVLKNAKDYEYKSIDDGPTIMGVDVAGAGADENAIVIVKKEDDIYKVVWAKGIKKMTFEELANYIIGIVDRFGVRKINVERNGVGEGLYQQLMSKAITGVNINGFYAVGRERVNMYYRTKALLEQNNLILNKNDRKMLMQSSNYEVKESADGTLRILKGKGHDDMWDALVYALYEKGMKVSIIDDFDKVIP